VRPLRRLRDERADLVFAFSQNSTGDTKFAPTIRFHMDSHKLSVKLLIDGVDTLPPAAFVPVFHGWIRDQAMADHLLIDVADYEHVPNGPGTVLVAHEANIHLDHEDQAGLLYIRKQPVAGASNFRDRLTAVFRATLQAAAKMELDPTVAGIQFRTNEVIFRIHDRLAAPNTEATYKAIYADLEAFLAQLYQGDVALEHRHDALRLFAVRIKSTSKPSVTELLTRLESTVTAAV
jgi:hypothetical protein